MRVNAGSIEMYNVLKMKTVLKRVNSTAFEIYFSAYLVNSNIFAHIRAIICESHVIPSNSKNAYSSSGLYAIIVYITLNKIILHKQIAP